MAKRWLVALVASLGVLCALPAVSGAAGIVNGGFESGDLSGWTVVGLVDEEPVEPDEDEEGEVFPLFPFWHTYEAGEEGIGSDNALFPPPQGDYAATSDQEGPGAKVLYQDVELDQTGELYLSMYAFYSSAAPIAVPQPDSFQAGEEGPGGEPDNQQFRIEVIDPAAPITTVDPADIRATVFRTQNGSAQTANPTIVGADLAAFAGETVRLRIAEIDNRGYFNAGVDAVTIGAKPVTPAPPAPSPAAPPSNAIAIGKLTRNKKQGTARIVVNLPGAGSLSVRDVARKARIKPKTATSAGAGAITVALSPTAKGRKALNASGKLTAKLSFSFTPAGGAVGSVSRTILLKKALPKP